MIVSHRVQSFQAFQRLHSIAKKDYPLYADMMDDTRFVRPLSELRCSDGSSVFVCRVFWKTETGMRMGGTADIASSLFAATRENILVGFVEVRQKGVRR